ncbi:GNAT family N-acetyltransferase [Kaustia mangrovi]|uniref:GNAT family N-acetyltransferase n=1 Tax=Kaustia mangrovi TaxID=2593653 RepID=A0A7S8C1M8_9HYPH|nr:GNAT family N-acetyltransferase [Kaustia mangrovi]QPC41721.1 GNAT family N-acetyltransferase [Kaustia mangrovi]
MTRTIDTVVTFLEMTEQPSLVDIHPPVNLKVALMRAEEIPVHFYRYLYDTVGTGLYWIDRKVLSDEALANIIHDENVEVFVAYGHGVPAGFFEIDARKPEEVWLAYFGIVPDFQGQGVGKWLLAEAIGTAWAKGPERVRVETCTLDHPRALALYQRMGFVPYAQEDKTMEVPDTA